MSTLTISLVVILLLLGCVHAQDNAAQELVNEHPELLVVLNNYFGCGKWENQTCLECSKDYFFNVKGICCQVSPQCRQFNQAQGICEGCYEGYSLYNGTCKVITSQDQINPGCLSWDGNHNCLSCSARFYFNAQKICTQVSDYCYTWNSDGSCTSCYGGYVLNSAGSCIVNPTPFTPSKDSLCKTWTSDSCVACADRAYFDANGVCQGVSSNCNTWDGKTGDCLTCFGGYDLSKGSCIFSASNTAKPSDLGCHQWDWKIQVCLSCSSNWVFNENNICVPVSDFCKTANTNGVCTSCYNGYDLTNGACLVSPSNTARPSDLGCAVWSWAENVCKQCSKNWVFNSNRVCSQVSSLCKSYDDAGACSSCYQGYDLNNGACKLSASNNAKPADSGCSNWDWNSQVCLACSKNWVFNKNGVCVPVSDQCYTSDANGLCTSCYKGYDLKSGICYFSESNNKGPLDGGCGKWDWNNLICIECSKGWTFNEKGVCSEVSDQCKTWDSAGKCTACFKGYDLKDGSCVFSSFNNAKPSDSGCGKWDWDNQVCVSCSNGWTFNANKVCVPVSDQCKTWDSAGKCTACFKGYDLKDGSCVFSSFNNAKPSDSGCGQWDWDNQICLKCSTNWVFNSQGVCVPVSDQCLSWDSNGRCNSCFKGYDLKNGSCVFSASNNAKPSDSGCGKWDWNNQVCLQCSSGWIFNENKICTPVNDQCKSWDATGACISCFTGYTVSNGACVHSNPLCKTSSSNGACLSCFTGYVLIKDGCTQISSLASLYLYYSQCCPEKLASLLNKDGTPKST